MRRIVIASLKGGAAKSTCATALSLGLARHGPTLLIDLDGQANASFTAMHGAPIEGPTLSDVMLRRVAAEDAIRPTPTPNLDLLPADQSLSGVNVSLVQELGRDTRLRTALAPHEGRWRYCVIDTAPSITTMLANALVFGEEVIVPVDPGVYAMLGLVQMQDVIAEVREAYSNSALRIAGLLLTKVQRTSVARDVEAELRRRFPEQTYRTTIPMSSAVEAAHTRGLTVLEHAPKSAAAVAYTALVEEVLSHGGEEDGGRVVSGRRARADGSPKAGGRRAG
jgi:chromosome partitioning protein